MPSYAREVKNELARIFDEEAECLRAELAALIKFGAIIAERQMIFSTSNAAVARKVINLLKKLYPDTKKEVAAARRKKFTGWTRYFIRIFMTGSIETLFKELDLPSIVPNDFAKVAYLRGAFQASGTVNRPEKSYYLEISALSESTALFVGKLFKDLEFNPTFRVRKDFFVNYICEGDAVEEFLGMIGAQETVERFEIARNLKEVRANVNRMVNVETANLNKAVDASKRQLRDIKFLIEHKIKVSQEIQAAMQIRLKFPECNIGELAEKLFITRQGLNYRFKRIHKLASDISNNLEN